MLQCEINNIICVMLQCEILKVKGISYTCVQQTESNRGSKLKKLKADFGNSLVVQWFQLSAFIANDMGSNPGWGTYLKMPAKKPPDFSASVHSSRDY